MLHAKKTQFLSIALIVCQMNQFGCRGQSTHSQVDSQSQIHSPQAAADSAPLDGRTLFRGIFFGDGPVAKKLPEIWGTDGDVRKASVNSKAQSAQELVDGIEKFRRKVCEKGCSAELDAGLSK